MATIALKREGDLLMLLGAEAGHLGQSLYMQVDVGAERAARRRRSISTPSAVPATWSEG